LEYRRARTVAEAVQLLNEPGVEARVLAGGTDLMIQLRRGEITAERLVDVSLVPEMHQITRVGADLVPARFVDGALVLGASVSFSQLLADDLIHEQASILAEMAAEAGAVQLRNMGTIGGNIANAALAADSLPVLIALDATIHLVGPEGTRAMPLVSFITGPGKTQLRPGELITAFSFEPPAGQSCFIKVGRRNALNIARLSISAIGHLDAEGCIDDVRLVPGAALRHTRRASEVEAMLRGQRPGEALFEIAGKKMAEVMIAESGRRWSTPYKEPVITTITRRALAAVFGDASRDKSAFLGMMAELHQDSQHPVMASPPAKAEHPHPQVQHAGQLQPIAFTLNGELVTVDAPVGISLLTLLRDYLGMLGAKEGCNTGECGACTVILDGEALLSCLLLAHQANGRDIITIEGLRSTEGGLSDLQKAFIEHGAVQCGMCIPGMLLSAEALLARTLNPTREEIRYGIAGNLCRCTGYQQIVDAIEATAAQRRLASLPFGRNVPRTGTVRRSRAGD